MKSASLPLYDLVQRLRHYGTENLGLKLLSLLLAILLFAISRQPLREVKLVGVQLEYQGLAAGYEISGETNQTVSVRIRGPRSVIRNILPNQITVVANLSNKEPGDRVVQLKTSDVSLPEGVEVLQIDPATIRLRVEATLRKRVSIKPELIGKVADGFEVYQVKVEPQIVEIEGPQSQVDQVEFVMTESAQLAGRATSFRMKVDVDHPNHAIRILTPGPINLAIEVGEQRTTRKIVDLPVRWLNSPYGSRLLTPTVDIELYGPRSLIESLNPDQIRVELKTSDMPANTRTAKPVIVLPPEAESRVEVLGLTPSEVKFKRL